MKNIEKRLSVYLGSFIMVSMLLVCSDEIVCGQEHEMHNMHTMHEMHTMPGRREIVHMRFNSDTPDSLVYGSWESVIPATGGGSIGKSLGMQTVHTILLPSGKIQY